MIALAVAAHVVLGLVVLWMMAKMFVTWHESRVYNLFLEEYRNRLASGRVTRDEAIEFMSGAGSPETWRDHARRWGYKC